MKILTCMDDEDLPRFPEIPTARHHMNDVVTSQVMETATEVAIGIGVRCLQWAVHLTIGARHHQPITHHLEPDLSTVEGPHLPALWATPSKFDHISSYS